MSIISSIKYLFAFVCSVAAAYMVLQMFQAESQTAETFTQYAQWAVAGGVVFLLMGVSHILLNQEDSVKTTFDADSAKK